ncbi:uncharacterized protein LOC119837957 [Zerene cesonia]|uniref:uncharacterized protein LOC119837957 n=1 Tax=Zerene cesonia TaxID=33412 RepID=UPI0018E5430A|nr:uncharacterized protein LOC119837957 [Zerene cesonia]
MAETRRSYIFCAFLSGILSVLLIIVALASEGWVVSTGSTDEQNKDSVIRYGMFKGELALHIFITPSYNTLYMTCLSDINACAVSCKTDTQAREDEVRALAQGFRPNLACVAFTTVDTSNPLPDPPVISYGVYVSLLTLLFLQLALATLSAALAILNATKNPTEPIFGLPGCLWSNVATTVVGVTFMLFFGIYWVTSGWKEHLAFSYIALGSLRPGPGLGYSYWILLGANLCSIANVGLIVLRNYLLERDPPPPTIKVENHSDGTIFLY